MHILVRLAIAAVFVTYCMLWMDFDLTLSEVKKLIMGHRPLASSDYSSAFQIMDIAFDSCTLLKLPTWNAGLKKILRPQHNPMKACNKSWKPWVYLDGEGRLQVELETVDALVRCRARAIRHKSESSVYTDAWHDVNEAFVFMSDIVESECLQGNDTLFNYLHHQIWPEGERRKRSSRSKPSSATLLPPDYDNDTLASMELDANRTDGFATDAEKHLTIEERPPSVYIVLFDSISAPHGRRVFNKSINFLKNKFGAVDIRHVNKVGDNSHPNGIALLFGRMTAHLKRDIFSLPSVEPEWKNDKSCKSFLDNETFIISEFGKVGYKTLMAEDWASGVFNWPNCKGFKEQPTTHYMRPYQNHYEHQKKPNKFKKWMSAANCFEHHKVCIDYYDTNTFLHNDSKCALIWASRLGHDFPSRPFHADEYIRSFFEKNFVEFDNSFVFFMADHGLRFGTLRNSEEGKREVKNPMLMLSVPRLLRSNKELIKNIEFNSGQLLTMFDVHATFVDILEHIAPFPLTISSLDFSVRLSLTGRTREEGSSIFRPLPPGSRNCKTLPIPVQFCLCEIERQKIRTNSTLKAIGDAVVNLINRRLNDEGAANLCSTLTLFKVKEASHIKGTHRLYEATVVANPGKGQFQAYVRDLSPNDTVHDFAAVVPDAERLNSYGRQAECISNNEIRPYCYCKQNVEHATTFSPKMNNKNATLKNNPRSVTINR